MGEDNDWTIEWKISPSYARVYDKDFRVTPFRISIDPNTNEETYTIQPSESGDASRFLEI